MNNPNFSGKFFNLFLEAENGWVKNKKEAPGAEIPGALSILYIVGSVAIPGRSFGWWHRRRWSGSAR